MVLLGVSGCEPAAEDTRLDVPADLKDLRQNALNCSRDVQWTHAERSEHCVLVAENIFKDSQNECWESDSKNCLNWRLVHSDISLIYQGAIAESLFQFGKSDEMTEVAADEFSRMIYLNGEIMRNLFERCVEDEQKELEVTGLRKILDIPLRPLDENQRCFRAGYPAFEVEPVNQS